MSSQQQQFSKAEHSQCMWPAHIAAQNHAFKSVQVVRLLIIENGDTMGIKYIWLSNIVSKYFTQYITAPTKHDFGYLGNVSYNKDSYW